MIDDPELNVAMLRASGPLVAAAHAYGPLPAVDSEAFLNGPIVVRQAVLCVVGISRVHLGDPVRALLAETSRDVHGGDRAMWAALAGRATTHGPHSAVLARRYPPTGDRDLWIRYGPGGPPTEAGGTAA